MTRVFDGLATICNRTFGGAVVHVREGYADRTIHAIFRADPIEDLDIEGIAIRTVSPILSALTADAELISTGDRIRTPRDGDYLVVNHLATGSPASDRFVIFELETADV